MALQLTDSNFNQEVLESGKLALIDFWAVWCGPCKMLAPVIEELAEEYEGTAVIGKMDVDSNPTVPMQYGIRSLPTIVFLKDGKIVDRHVGVTTKAVLKEKIEKNL